MALDYYDILGVPPKADAGEIRKAYRLLALKWHPDRNPADPWAANRFLQVGEAYRVLRDPVSRTAYDWLWSQEKLRGKDLGASLPGSGREPEPPASQEISSRQWRRPSGPGGNPALGGSRRRRKKRAGPAGIPSPQRQQWPSPGSGYLATRLQRYTPPFPRLAQQPASHRLKVGDAPHSGSPRPGHGPAAARMAGGPGDHGQFGDQRHWRAAAPENCHSTRRPGRPVPGRQGGWQRDRG
jgi:curved DNA-binding protein CbpA